MIEVLSLLTLPQTSKAFTAVRSNAIDPFDNGSASPRRKAARLATDSDAASASRSNRNTTSDGPFKIKIIGDEPKKPRDSDGPFALLRRSMRIILDRDSSETLPASNESMYDACRFVVTISNNGEGLHECLKMELQKYLGHIATRLESFVPAKDRRADDEDQHYLIGWVTEFVGILDWFERQVNRLEGLLTYLNQVYVPSIPNGLGVRELAFKVFREKIFENFDIASILRDRVQRWAEYERQLQLESSWRNDIKKLISHLIKHQQYSAFEEYYVQITSDFYKNESEKSAQKLRDRPTAFFKDARNRIDQEIQRSKDVLPVGSWSLLRETTERAIWTGRLEWLSSETLGPYMEKADERHELGTMYDLFKRVDGVKALVFAFRSYVRKTVEDIVKDQDRDEEMVQRLLDFKQIADKTISNYFCDEKIGTPSNHTASPRKARSSSNSVNKQVDASTSTPTKLPNSDFTYALTDAFNVGFKARRNKPAEMIAKYLDKLMRKGQGKTSDKDFEDLLDAVLALYRFTDDKDVFRTFYHRSLAKRLLLEKSASDDFEAAMLKKLKEKYDPEFGMGEDMFKDLALSKEMISDYHSKLPEESSGHKLNAMVLQRSAWPFSVQKAVIDLPPEMQSDLSSFANYYKNKHSGHVLDWDHALGTMTMKARFKPGVKELSLSLYQGIILLLFNEAPDWGFKDIKDRVRLEDAELRRTLQSLACGKKKVLKKVPPGKDVEDGDVFKFNADFTDERQRVHINSIQAKVSPEESRRTNISIEGDRKHYLDAAIVRIMKAKKEMTYEQLKTATIDAVKSHFVPQVDAIKKRIDSLVESDYLERSVDDKNKFLYVA